MEQKMKMKEGGGKVYPVGGNVARKVHRNDNPHLDRLHPPQISELVAQKQVSVYSRVSNKRAANLIVF